MKAYWQISLEPMAKDKAMFMTPKGLYYFTYMPFGLHRAAATFE